jgi:hypothetical protein
MNATDSYRPMVSQETILEMAQEKVLEDADLFTDWLTAECMEPITIRECGYFGHISTSRIVTEILMKARATDQQIAEGWKEIRRRYLEDNQGAVSSEVQRLSAED